MNPGRNQLSADGPTEQKIRNSGISVMYLIRRSIWEHVTQRGQAPLGKKPVVSIY